MIGSALCLYWSPSLIALFSGPLHIPGNHLSSYETVFYKRAFTPLGSQSIAFQISAFKTVKRHEEGVEIKGITKKITS